jgi:hypothetical protein
MEKELMNQVGSLEKKTTISEPKEAALGDQEVKEIIRDVLNELYHSKRVK